MDVSTYPPSSPAVGPSPPTSVADPDAKLEQLAGLIPPVAEGRGVLDGAFAVLDAPGSIRLGNDHICAALAGRRHKAVSVLRPQATSRAHWGRADPGKPNQSCTSCALSFELRTAGLSASGAAPR